MHRIGTVTLIAFVLVALALPAFAEDGATLFKAKCASCHAADGSGSAMGNKLGTKPLGSTDVQKLSDADLGKAITAGKGKMPPFKSLTAEQVTSLVAHIRDFGKK